MGLKWECGGSVRKLRLRVRSDSRALEMCYISSYLDEGVLKMNCLKQNRE